MFEIYLRDLRPHADDETYFRPHDVRRSVTNFLSNRCLGRAASAILAHKQPIDDGERDEETTGQRMARTTCRYYHTAQQITLKTQGLELWVEALEAALESERERVEEIGRSLG